MNVQRVAAWFDERRAWCMSLLRIYLGVGLMVKAIKFVAEKEELLQLMVDNKMLWAGMAMVHIVIMTHLLGGSLMALGFGTRIGALIQVPNLVGAVFFVHWSGGVLGFAEELRFSALVLFLLLLFVWHGSGPLSLKAYLQARSAPA